MDASEEKVGEAMAEATRQYLAERPRTALGYVEAALVADPNCYEALVLAGELHAFCAAELELTDQEGSARALEYFDRAIAARPNEADAYAGKALVLLHSGDSDAALAAADAGLARLGSAPPESDQPAAAVWTNIGETLYRAKALALLEMDRSDDARHALAKGLERFPGSTYLTQVVDEFLGS